MSGIFFGMLGIPVADNPVIALERELEEEKARPVRTAANPLPALRLVAPQRRQVVLHLQL